MAFPGSITDDYKGDFQSKPMCFALNNFVLAVKE